jgi:hypothetical protein
MRFVHLAPRSAVAAIRRNGLRVGNGRRGRGVYAVPLFRIRRSRPRAPDDPDDDAVDVSAPLTSATLWRHTLWPSGAGHPRPVAIVFVLPQQCWPIDVFLEVAPLGAEALLDRIQSVASVDLVVTDESFAHVRRASRGRMLSDLMATTGSADALGKLLHLYVEYGACAWSKYDDKMEVVVHRSIPPSAIVGLHSLSERNSSAKRRASRTRGRLLGADSAEGDGEEE